MKNPLWPLTIDPLPLKDAPKDDASSGFHVVFHQSSYTVKAFIYDSSNILVDVIAEHTFMECYNSVANNYPQASWRPN